MTRTLILTIGTGDRENLKQTLFDPLMKSIGDGEWGRIVLLPSHETEGNAQHLEVLAAHHGIEIRPLPKAGAENDPDACFDWFDQVIGDLRQSGCMVDEITADFTRGTKAMSAALVLAGVRNGISSLRYISGERDGRGMVTAGTETIRHISPIRALARRTQDMAYRLLRDGAFAAADDLLGQMLPDPSHPFSGLGPTSTDSTALEAARQVARFLSAWDRLDHAKAASLPLPSAADLPADWIATLPKEAEINWIHRLADKPGDDDFKARADWLRLLIIDLFANAERRVRQGQFEDALVRCYRLLELVGQARLFDRGYDSARIPLTAAVQEFQKKLRKSNSTLPTMKDGCLQMPREQAARFLKFLNDDLAKSLIGDDIKDVKNRNYSILIHGFENKAPADLTAWNVLLQKIDNIIHDDRNNSEYCDAQLNVARFPSFVR
ncbi:MAG: TIGR02710 family CRISPR-associated CARF protein [Azospirillaceae bacterium]|nr:TIGR02710 family CRISPR-associated CARF protein [Azospirillaceae bacterium]